MSGRHFGLHDVTVEIGGRVALGRITAQLAPGQVTALIGGDGAGKTTASRALVGLTPVTSGQVRRPPAGAIGYQPEGAGTWADLTVAENLDFVARAHGRPDPARRQELLAVTALNGAEDRLAGKLSGGMRQKLAVAMAMLPRPQLIVLDEPTTGLDPVSRAELWRLLLRSAAEGAALMVTTSYLNEAERAHQVVVLDEGRMVATGSAADIQAGFRGTLSLSAVRPDEGYAWRRGRTWRVWHPQTAPSASSVPPDLEDVVTAAALARAGAGR